MLTYKTAQRIDPLPRTLRRFANPELVCEGWYVVGSARAIRIGGIKRVGSPGTELEFAL